MLKLWLWILGAVWIGLGGFVGVGFGDEGAEVEGVAGVMPGAGAMPGIEVNVEGGYVELTGRMSPRLGDWLELVACFGPTREHESLVTVDARPSQIHLALILLGLEPGKPLSWRQEGGKQVVEPATGPWVEVYFVVDDEQAPEGERVIAANEWVVDQQTGEPLEDHRWLFSGSRWVTWEREEGEVESHYVADLNGTVISLVHFGDDLLARGDTAQTNQTDGQQWNAGEGVAEVGEAVRLRLVMVRADHSGDATSGSE